MHCLLFVQFYPVFLQFKHHQPESDQPQQTLQHYHRIINTNMLALNLSKTVSAELLVNLIF